MSNQQEATVNADGSQTFGSEPPLDQEPVDEGFAEEILKEAVKGIDPAFYLLIAVAIALALYYFLVMQKKKTQQDDDFFSNLDGEKFNLTLPSEVEEYNKIRVKCESQGWEPGVGPSPGTNPNTGGPHRILAQALMKRAIADIPIVQYIQKESQGMGKLYAKSMCSVAQWRAYQNAEALVSQEVESVRGQADDIEPGWSEVIWKQAVQYHGMLKKKHEMDAAQAQAAAKATIAQTTTATPKTTSTTTASTVSKPPKKLSPQDEAKAKELAAQKAAEELIKEEEREKNAKKSFSGAKKGFLESKGKKK